MSTKTTKIEWTDKTWNPVTGCTKISQGCAHCYAEVMSRRLNAMGLEKYRNGFQLTLHEDDFCEPLQWKKPHNIFTWGSDGIKRNKHANGKLLLGEVIQQMPEKMAV